MKLEARLIRVPLAESREVLLTASHYVSAMRERGEQVLRWGMVALDGESVTIEVALVLEAGRSPSPLNRPEAPPASSGINAALVIPTGVGAATGGFIGDAGPIARLLTAASDTLIIHPNVVNAADLYGGSKKSPYVDGYTLDQFFGGTTHLDQRGSRRIGLILDQLEEQERVRVLNAANATASVCGVNLVGAMVCNEKLKAHVELSRFGHYVGVVHNAQTLIQAAENLAARGADAIAVVTDIQGVTAADYDSHYHGSGPNPIGSIEALISRAITWSTGLPCAHAPAFGQTIGIATEVIDPRAAAEVVSGTGLPCVLLGLSRAPVPVAKGGMAVEDLSAIIVPFECAGGAPAEASQRYGVPLVAVRSNRCVVGVSAERLGVPCVVVDNYLEATAFLVARRACVSWSSVSGVPAKLEVYEPNH